MPDACRAVPAATVQQYLQGKAKVTSPLPVNGAAEDTSQESASRSVGMKPRLLVGHP